MKAIFFVILCAVTSCLLVSCGEQPNLSAEDRAKDPNSLKVVNISRIFMHENNMFSFLVPGKHDGNYVLKTYNSLVRGGTKDGDENMRRIQSGVVFRFDVLPDKPMWVEVSSDGWLEVVHAHSPASIEGAGWNRGKNGAGQTVVVE
jgi:hypothetical protein